MSIVMPARKPIPVRLARRAFTLIAAAAAAGLMAMAIAAGSPGAPGVTHHSLADHGIGVNGGAEPRVLAGIQGSGAVNAYSNEVWNY